MKRTVWTIAALFVVLLVEMTWLMWKGPTIEYAKAWPFKTVQPYNGDWWMAAKTVDERDERLAVLEGIGQCRFQGTSKDGYVEFSYRLSYGIDQYYTRHPSERSLSIYEVWPKLGEGTYLSTYSDDGKTNKSWWKQETGLSRLRYVEGYLWCMRNTEKNPAQRYSREAPFYVQKINQYYKDNVSHDHLDRIVTILSRYQDEKAK